MTDFVLLEADAYYKSLLKEIPKAKKRIVIASMVLLWGERTAPIFIMLQDAVKRGVRVTILFDNYTRMTYFHHLEGPGKERLRQTFRTLEDLSLQGAKICSFGRIGFPPQKGRCHIKITVIDDISYSFGGVNFMDEAFNNLDCMITSKNPDVADCLTQLVTRVCKTRPPLLDGEVSLGRKGSVLFDGGRPKQSIIYERACELASQAKKIYYAGHMVPSGQLARLLSETDSTIYTSRPEQMMSLTGIGQAYDQQKYRLVNSYQGDRYLHTKMILFELPRGKKALLTGSHNFSYRGVSFGTQEVCLYSRDEKLWQTLYDYLQKRIAKAHTSTKK